MSQMRRWMCIFELREPAILSWTQQLVLNEYGNAFWCCWRSKTYLQNRLVPENFGAEPNIASSACAGFDWTTIFGKLRSCIGECWSEFLFLDALPRANSIAQNTSDIRDTESFRYQARPDARLDNKTSTGANFERTLQKQEICRNFSGKPRQCSVSHDTTHPSIIVQHWI